VLQQQMAALPGTFLDESRGLQFAKHFGPGHSKIINLPIGFVNAPIAR
jgi:hypothetical protein